MSDKGEKKRRGRLNTTWMEKKQAKKTRHNIPTTFGASGPKSAKRSKERIDNGAHTAIHIAS
jgi:hypothetical protein